MFFSRRGSLHIGQCQVNILPQQSADKKVTGRLSAVDRPTVGRVRMAYFSLEVGRLSTDDWPMPNR